MALGRSRSCQSADRRRCVAEVAVDTGKTTPSILPTITIEDADNIPHPNGHSQKTVPDSPASPTWPTDPTSPDTPEVPGAMPNGPAPEIPDWYKVGWRDVSGVDKPVVKAEGEEKEKELLSLFLSEQFYGEWYHNAAMVVVVSSLHCID